MHDDDPTKFVHEYINRTLTTSYLITFAKFNVFFLGYALLVTTVLENFFPELKDDPFFTSYLDPIAWLAGFIYMAFLNETMQGFNTEVKIYLSYLQRVERIMMRCCQENCATIFPVLSVLIDQGDFLRGEQLPAYFEQFVAADPTRDIKLKIVGQPFGEATRYLVSQLKVMFSSDPVGDSEANQLFEIIQGWEARVMIKEPTFMKAQNVVFLVVWFGVWLPVTLWARIGGGPTVFLFAFISYVLWGTAIQRNWMGSAWCPDRPFKGSDHENWPEKFKSSLVSIMKQRETLSRTSSLSRALTSSSRLTSMRLP
jgi:hypothetical protein